MHGPGLAPLYKTGFPAAALEEHLQLLVGDAGEDGRVSHFKAIEVENRQDSSIADGIEKLVGVPGGSQRAGLRLAVANDAGGDQIRVIHDGAEGVRQGVAQFSPLVDGTWGFRGCVAGDAAGERELAEQPLHSLGVLTDVGIDLAVGAVQVVLGYHGVPSVAGAADVDHVQLILDDCAVEMGIDKILAGAGAPVAHDVLLQIGGLQKFPQADR